MHDLKTGGFSRRDFISSIAVGAGAVLVSSSGVAAEEDATPRRAGGMTLTKDGEEWGGEFILAHGKRLFHVYDDFCVLEFTDKFTACGCGEQLAIGALHAIEAVNERNPKNRTEPKAMLEIALQTAEKYSGFVRGPFHFVQNF